MLKLGWLQRAMGKWLRVCLALFMACLLGGCQNSFSTPEEASLALGISAKQWKEAEPVVQGQWAHAYRSYRAWLKPQAVARTANTLSVYVHGGLAHFSDAESAFSAEGVVLRDGECQPLPLVQSSGKKSTKLWMCFRDQELYIDPNPLDASYFHGAIVIPLHTRWNDQGVEFCALRTKGLAKLRGACVWMQQNARNMAFDARSMEMVRTKSSKVAFTTWKLEPEGAYS